MCEYCSELFTGDYGEYLISTDVNIGDIKKAMKILTFLADCDDDEVFMFTEIYFNGNDGIVSEDRIKVNYCPICGRKLVKEKM